MSMYSDNEGLKKRQEEMRIRMEAKKEAGRLGRNVRLGRPKRKK